MYDAVVVGSGPNGLAAAITLARAEWSVLLIEGAGTPGGGTRSEPLTLPGFVHDVCSAVHPLAIGTPFFEALPLASLGLQWVHPPAALAHPLEGGRAVVLEGSVEDTARNLELEADAEGYRRLLGPLVADWSRLAPLLLGPPRPPRHPVASVRFAMRALRSARSLVDRNLEGPDARALFAGLAGHSMLPLEKPASAAVGLVLAMAGHAHGWPMPRGGAGQIASALVRYLESLGGEVEVDRRIHTLEELPPAAAYLFDVTPRQLLSIAGDALPGRYRRRLARFRHGPGVFKIDWALSEPIPWTAEGCRRAGTIHVGGGFDEIARAEEAVSEGRHPERPFALLAQPTLFDPTRAPPGRHTAWAYCHVPHGSKRDMTEVLEAQVERFAPGFRDVILERHTIDAAGMEARNPNYVGGDISGGSQDLRQIVARPTPGFTPYATPNPTLFICSSSTPPGGGVHGMCGYHAARAALRRIRPSRPFLRSRGREAAPLAPGLLGREGAAP